MLCWWHDNSSIHHLPLRNHAHTVGRALRFCSIRIMYMYSSSVRYRKDRDLKINAETERDMTTWWVVMHNIFIVIHRSFLLQSPEYKCHWGINMLQMPKVVPFFSSSGRVYLQQRLLAAVIINQLNQMYFIWQKCVTQLITKSFTHKINVQNVRKIPTWVTD